MRCRVCKGRAVIDIRRHNADFCQEHFLRYCKQQTEKAISEFTMLDPADKVLVAVSGGKDSLAIWDILLELGYEVDGLYVGLGIGEYSDRSGQYAQRFADQRQATLRTVDLRQDYGYDVPTAAKVTKRVPCSACGMSKRHLFDSETLAGGYDVLVTGHNLDDEAAVLFGNVLRWQMNYLRRQSPVLAAGHGFPKKVKPLVRLTERETAAYCILRNIDYLVEECPMAAGNKHLQYKETLNALEVASPGSKGDFYFGYLKRAAQNLADSAETDDGRSSLSSCQRCGGPAESDICAFCRLVDRAAGAEPVSINLTGKPLRTDGANKLSARKSSASKPSATNSESATTGAGTGGRAKTDHSTAGNSIGGESS